MMQTAPYWRIDAFVGDGALGNPAAIIECKRWPGDGVMQEVASESGGAATAFLVRDESGAADWQIRWFGPSGEIELCGHATLASAHMLLRRSDGDAISFRTRRAGVIEARREGDLIELGLPIIATEPEPWPEVSSFLGAEPMEAFRSEKGYAALLFESEEAVRALEPDFSAVAALGNVQIACSAPGKNSDIVSRVFTRAGGEDSVTGSAHAVLAPIWTARLGREELTAEQASARGGKLHLRMDGDRVWVGGKSVTVIEGQFYLRG